MYTHGKSEEYIDALKKEISGLQVSSSLETLYIGGGTPTSLTTELLTELMTHVSGHFGFSEDYEATIETNPGTADSDKFEYLISSGINRISIGIQSFDDALLNFLGRIHSSEEAENAVGLARKAGFQNISIDLIYGIPGQTFITWKETLEKAASLKPDHISTYEITYEKGTKLFEMIQDNVLADNMLPEEDLIVEMYEYTIDFLESRGFHHYEISNFALPGFECRHNINYWDRGEYYGVGLGAHSFLNSMRYFNVSDLERYVRMAGNNRSPVDAEEKITGDMALSETMFLGLRKTDGIAIEKMTNTLGRNILTCYHETIKDLQSKGLIEITDSFCSHESVLRLTRRGLLLSNEVFMKFI
jgi:oxygen-independent coproporphyrinogen-3 oxidase